MILLLINLLKDIYIYIYITLYIYLILAIVKPILIGLIIIISGLILAKSKPQARTIVAYSFIIVLLIIAIIILLIFVTCERPPIVNMTDGS